MEKSGTSNHSPHGGEQFQGLVMGTLFAILVGWVLFIARDILIPIVFSVMVVYVIIGTDRLVTRIPGLGGSLPALLRHTLVVLLIAGALGLLGWMVLNSLDEMVARAAHYQSSLVSLVQRYSALAGVESEPTWETIRDRALAMVSPQRMVALLLLSLTSIVASLIVVALYVVFLMLERRPFEKKIDRITGDAQQAARVRRVIGEVNSKIGTYLALKTGLSVLLGLASWAILAWRGVEFAVFWAVLIGLLNFVPYVGSILGVAIPSVFALLQFGTIGPALFVAMVLSIVQFLNGYILDPLLMGSSLNLSPFVILASLTIWAALWGIPGAFLAVPVTACLAMVLAEFPRTRSIAVLLSRDGNA